MKPTIIILLFIFMTNSSTALIYEHLPECAKPGVHFGAGFGALAGGVTGAAAFTSTSLGGASVATCPTFAMASLTGTGGALLGGPLVPIGGLLAGALFGSLAGGSAGGWVQCRKSQTEESAKAIDFYIRNHPDGDVLEQIRESTKNFFRLPKLTAYRFVVELVQISELMQISFAET